MWTRIYFGVLAAAVMVVAFFTYYSWSWLESIGRPEDAIAGYQSTSGIAWTMLCVTTIALAFIAAGVMWATERAWALWTTFVFFAVFLAFDGLYLNRSYQNLLERTTGIDTRLWATPVITVLILIGVAVLTLALQYLIHIIRRKFFPETPAIEIEAESESSRLM